LLRFSVIIPNLNSPTIDQTLQSLERQHCDQACFEVIVVGMDKPGLVSVRAGVRFFPSDRPLYPGEARNLGAASSSAEILAFIDADCLAAPDWLAVLDERFKDSEVNIIGGGITFAASNYWSLADNISMFHDYLASLPPGRRSQLPSLNLAIRRTLFEDNDGFEAGRRTGEDSDLTIRLRRQGQILYFEPRAVIQHRPPRDSLSELLTHSYKHGQNSIKVDPRHRGEPGLPSLLRTRGGILLGAPLLATGITARIFTSDRSLRRFWYTAPAILLSKLAWCFGAAARPRLENERQAV
jgi:glycosyltransferase involved in cell wall biosynthesis